MIRIYIDDDFKPGLSLKIPKAEAHYLRVNRHAKRRARSTGNESGARPEDGGEGFVRGEAIEAFNSRGQVAEGYLREGLFQIECVKSSPFPIYPVTLALALPDNAALESVVRSASELGTERLIFFEGDRSQAAESRMPGAVKRAERIAKESMRQSARPRPLVLEAGKRLESLKLAGTIVFLDEIENDDETKSECPMNDVDHGGRPSPRQTPSTVIIGPEGGWSPRERALSRERTWTTRHYATPIMRVVTVVPVALFDMIRA